MIREETDNKIYERRRSALRTGDMVAVRGSNWMAKLIQLGTWSEVSHVAVILVQEGRLWIVESTTGSTLPDAKHGEIMCGIQMHLLSQWLDMHARAGNEVYSYRLHKPLNKREKENVVNWLLQTHAKRVPYDYLGAYQSWEDLSADKKEDLRLLFCSELYVAMLKQAPRLQDVNASEQHPRDVVDLSIFRQRVRLV